MLVRISLVAGVRDGVATVYDGYGRRLRRIVWDACKPCTAQDIVWRNWSVKQYRSLHGGYKDFDRCWKDPWIKWASNCAASDRCRGSAMSRLDKPEQKHNDLTWGCWSHEQQTRIISKTHQARHAIRRERALQEWRAWATNTSSNMHQRHRRIAESKAQRHSEDAS